MWSSLVSQGLHDTHSKVKTLFKPPPGHVSHQPKQAKEPKPSKGGKLTLPLDGKSFKLTFHRDRDTGKEGLQGHLQPVTMKQAAISFTRGGGWEGHSEKVSQTWGPWNWADLKEEQHQHSLA